MPFEWDQYNLAKIAAHGLTQPEVEAVLADPEKTIEQSCEEEPRWLTEGHAAGKRIIVIWTVRGEAVRPVTAWAESRARKRI
jgi:uncharacterized DUF497 family protein